MKRSFSNLTVATGLAVLLALAACQSTPPPAKSQGPSDNPVSLVASGNTALKGGDLGAASEAFARALELDPDNLPALRGTIRVALEAGRPKPGLEAAERAFKLSKTPVDEREFLAFKIRLLAIAKDGDWVKEVNDLYYRRLDKDLDMDADPRVRLAMGIAAMELGDMPSAAINFRRALEKPGAHVPEAERAMQQMQARFRAGLGGGEIADIANKQRIARRDLVFLLFKDLKIDEFVPDRASDRPRRGEAGEDDKKDYGKDELAALILKTHRLRFRGFKIDDGNFRPADSLSREEFALVLEDLIIWRFNNRALARKFIGSASPFADLQPTRPSFNAMLTAISRGLLTTSVNGEANPTGSVTGADAVLALRNLKGLKQ